MFTFRWVVDDLPLLLFQNKPNSIAKLSLLSFPTGYLR